MEQSPSTVPPEEFKFIRLKEVLSITGLSRSTIYSEIKAGTFPKPVKHGARTSLWIKSEVLQWAARTIAASRSAGKA